MLATNPCATCRMCWIAPTNSPHNIPASGAGAALDDGLYGKAFAGLSLGGGRHWPYHDQHHLVAETGAEFLGR